MRHVMERAAMLRYGVLVGTGLTALCLGSLWLAVNFPQEYATEFYVTKGIVGLVASGLLIAHMDDAWERMESGAQMGRYLMLLFATVISGAGSYGQIKHGDEVRLQNIGGLEFLIGVIVVMIYSIVEDQRRHRS